MIDLNTDGLAIPAVCESFLEALEEGAPSSLAGAEAFRETDWNDDRLFARYDWIAAPATRVAEVRLQFLPDENSIWIGSLEVHPAWRGRRYGTEIVRAVERAASDIGVRRIRLFPRLEATGFWFHLGYVRESHTRYLRKTIHSSCLLAQ